MSEKIFNLFLFISDTVIVEIGVKTYELGDFQASDDDKQSFLLSRVLTDFSEAQRFPLPSRYKILDIGTGELVSGISSNVWQSLCESGRHLEVFGEALTLLGSSDAPLFCLTPVVDGKPIVQEIDQAVDDEDSARTRHTAFLREKYVELAAFAWEGFQREGKGVVLIIDDAETGVQAKYVPKSQADGSAFSSDLKRMVGDYDPTQHFVVTILGPDIGESDYCIGVEDLPPPEAAEFLKNGSQQP